MKENAEGTYKTKHAEAARLIYTTTTHGHIEPAELEVHVHRPLHLGEDSSNDVVSPGASGLVRDEERPSKHRNRTYPSREDIGRLLHMSSADAAKALVSAQVLSSIPLGLAACEV